MFVGFICFCLGCVVFSLGWVWCWFRLGWGGCLVLVLGVFSVYYVVGVLFCLVLFYGVWLA